MEKSRILIVEDESIVGHTLKVWLDGMGYEVPSVVRTGEEAVDKAGTDRPDLILMDIMLAGEIDGIESADRIRSLYNIPVIYLTAYGDHEITKRAKSTMPLGFIIKPYDKRELKVAIDVALYKSKIEKKLVESEEKYRLLFESSINPVTILDRDGIILMTNPSCSNNIGTDRNGESIFDIIPDLNDEHRTIIRKVVDEGIEVQREDCLEMASGLRWFWSTLRPIADVEGRRYGVQILSYDITERKLMEMQIRASRDELEERVKERTADLLETEKKLKAQTNELIENNAALKALLRQRENDRREYENNILSNIKNLIQPYIDKLKTNKPVSDELTYLKIIESNLMEIVSPFAYKLSSGYLGLTPKELQIAALIKDGKHDKEIMEVLNISPDTVKVHRKNIRRKLGISGRKINLRTKLLSLEK